MTNKELLKIAFELELIDKDYDIKDIKIQKNENFFETILPGRKKNKNIKGKIFI